MTETLRAEVLAGLLNRHHIACLPRLRPSIGLVFL